MDAPQAADVSESRQAAFGADAGAREAQFRDLQPSSASIACSSRQLTFVRVYSTSGAMFDMVRANDKFIWIDGGFRCFGLAVLGAESTESSSKGQATPNWTSLPHAA
ncbi:MAG TPA: hypothetical protein VJV79_00515 [Polyangiaceae bacterium]|nr:hypothetical protein [Polyangiaceae bacterium]